MGNSGSSSTSSDPRFNSACRSFSAKELEDLKILYSSVVAKSGANVQYITPSVFKAFVGVEGPLGDRLFDLVTQKRNDQKLTFEDLIIAKATYEKGTKDDMAEFIYQLLDVFGDGVLGRDDLQSAIATMHSCLFPSNSAETGLDSNEFASILLNAATFDTDDHMSFEDFRRWFALLPSARRYFGSLLKPPKLGSQVPMLNFHETADPNIVLLRKEYAWIISGALSPELDEWKLLYHSSVNGQSFNTFLGRISNNEGPTILVIKDTEGYIYGGYASLPWEKHGDYYGDLKSFLFQLYPKASIFRATGANNNLQWFAVNFSSDSIPNGIGFGGKVDHFGLFVSASFDKGHSFECSTYGSPPLSKTSRIVPEVIECWGVLKGDQQERPDALKGTVLDRFKEDRNMLNLVGLANSSQ